MEKKIYQCFWQSWVNGMFLQSESSLKRSSSWARMVQGFCSFPVIPVLTLCSSLLFPSELTLPLPILEFLGKSVLGEYEWGSNLLSCTSPFPVKYRTSDQWEPQSQTWEHTTCFWFFFPDLIDLIDTFSPWASTLEYHRLTSMVLPGRIMSGSSPCSNFLSSQLFK